MFLGTKMTLLHEKYFGKGSIDEMFYPFIFVMLGISIVIEIAVRF